MTFNFDEVIDRRHSDSEKWGKYAEQDTIPLWVADSDFRSPPAVIDALQARVAHGVFGYGMAPRALSELFVTRMAQRYRWAIQPDWLVFLPGLVSGLNLTVRALTTPEQGTLAPSPIYPPFMKSAHLAGRAQIPMPMTLRNDRWLLAPDGAEAAISGKERLLMLCNPQNPGGTVYRREELEAQLAFAQRHDLLICSDEIHCDLLLEPGLQHIPIAALSDDAAQRSVTLMAPSKTFNIAGLGASIAIIPNAGLRRRFIDARTGIVPQVDILAFTAAEAAYRHGQPWLDAQLEYLRTNRDRVTERINAMPGLHTTRVEGTYLAWIDASGLPVENPQAFFEHAGVGLSDGADFGAAKFVRLNFACRRALLEQALDRMAQAIARL
ncbi:putative C-S lyase [Edwardsiella ictaluri]|uniref:MalY/PatB family protein n=1 Tax=Edwardsiella ictaluri TaxID=67780 RepID=UPI0009BF66DD|nr:PatB family C-S lyase [Edwardsiella ictaluri]ARD38191.1 aspartate aminotransferase [Edwardsiella ictaluri]QPW26606.1 putative C-S lyase [Edwardsiella ictaluri]